MCMIKSGKKNKGFTLIELMITMVVASIALTGIYGAFQAQVKANTTQQAVVDIQQNLRTAMYFLQRSVRMAGYDPLGTANPAFVADFSGFAGHDFGAITDENNIAFTLDADGDGIVDNDIDGTLPDDDNVNNELIAYRLNNNNLQVWREDPDQPPGTWDWLVMAENIASLQFGYLDGGNNPIVISSPITAAELAQIRAVQITVIAQPIQNFSALASAKRALTLTAQVQCRNIGLP